MSCSAALDDSLEFSYGQKGVDKADYDNLLENEKKNFKLLLGKVGSKLDYFLATENAIILYLNCSNIHISFFLVLIADLKRFQLCLFSCRIRDFFFYQ